MQHRAMAHTAKLLVAALLEVFGERFITRVLWSSSFPDFKSLD